MPFAPRRHANEQVQHTSVLELDAILSRGQVEKVMIEVLKPAPPNERLANPALAAAGKKKNHWVLRFIFKHRISYMFNGAPKDARSVRVSVELGENSLRCHKLSFRPMLNGEEMTRSAFAHWQFPHARGKFVRDFTECASGLLPFEYRTVSKTLAPSQGGSSSSRGRSSGRDLELFEHPNGCRDFTAQWFYRMHCAGLVEWESVTYAHAYGEHPVQRTEALHHIIGYRYSDQRTDFCPIIPAYLPEGVRKTQCGVKLVMHPNEGKRVVDRKTGREYWIVELPYKQGEHRVPVYRR